jgi:hypothetical protein
MAATLGVVALLVIARVAPAVTGFRSEALELRTVVYVVGLAILPAVWFMTGRPDDLLVADAFLLIPFAFGALGSSLGPLRAHRQLRQRRAPGRNLRPDRFRRRDPRTAGPA